jgi:hypothetical protein
MQTQVRILPLRPVCLARPTVGPHSYKVQIGVQFVGEVPICRTASGRNVVLPTEAELFNSARASFPGSPHHGRVATTGRSSNPAATDGANHARTRHAASSGQSPYAASAERRPQPALQRFVMPLLERPQSHRALQGATETMQPSMVLRQSATLRRPAHNARNSFRSGPDHGRRSALRRLRTWFDSGRDLRRAAEANLQTCCQMSALNPDASSCRRPWRNTLQNVSQRGAPRRIQVKVDVQHAAVCVVHGEAKPLPIEA